MHWKYWNLSKNTTVTTNNIIALNCEIEWVHSVDVQSVTCASNWKKKQRFDPSVQHHKRCKRIHFDAQVVRHHTSVPNSNANLVQNKSYSCFLLRLMLKSCIIFTVLPFSKSCTHYCYSNHSKSIAPNRIDFLFLQFLSIRQTTWQLVRANSSKIGFILPQPTIIFALVLFGIQIQYTVSQKSIVLCLCMC